MTWLMVLGYLAAGLLVARFVRCRTRMVDKVPTYNPKRHSVCDVQYDSLRFRGCSCGVGPQGSRESLSGTAVCYVIGAIPLWPLYALLATVFADLPRRKPVDVDAEIAELERKNEIGGAS